MANCTCYVNCSGSGGGGLSTIEPYFAEQIKMKEQLSKRKLKISIKPKKSEEENVRMQQTKSN